jgi:23S rRNA (cytidine2498-2'-O)-methyltransferase
MATQFYFALTNIEAETLLREEVRIRYPEFRPSYSRPGFVTFKGDSEINFNPYFCRISGTCLGKFSLSNLAFERAWVYALSDHLEIPPFLKVMSDQTIFKKGETVILIVMVGADEYWVGTYPLQSQHFQTPGEVSSILVRDDVPSRAYYKIAEAFEAFDLPFDHQEVVLELGSAPGGASLFLLEQDLRLLGVDTADMDPKILKHIDFKHLKKPFETLTQNDFKKDVDWIISDVNLPPTVVLREVFRLITFLNPRGLVITLKMNDLKHLEVVATVRDLMRKQGFSKTYLKYLPSHKKEICLVALQS